MPDLLHSEFLLPTVIFIAALIQAAGGIGFGLFAGPALVAVMGPVLGFQVAIFLNILVAAAIWVAERKDVSYELLWPMIPGCAVGMLAGMTAWYFAPAIVIKVALCVALAWVCLAPRPAMAREEESPFSLSMLSGLMGGALAVPGPAAAVYLRDAASTARAFRSTMMPLLFFVYLGCGFGLMMLNESGLQAPEIPFSFTSSAIAGLVCGMMLSRVLAESVLKTLTKILLLATLVALTATTSLDVMAQFA